MDPDPESKTNADPDPESKINADPADPDPSKNIVF